MSNEYKDWCFELMQELYHELAAEYSYTGEILPNKSVEDIQDLLFYWDELEKHFSRLKLNKDLYIKLKEMFG